MTIGRHYIGIFRHAKAEVEGDELTRPLTAIGIQSAKEQAKRLDINWSHVVCSPAERTIQTAILLSSKVPEELELLYVNGEPSKYVLEELVTKIETIASSASILIVTHQPMISPLVYLLCKERVDGNSIKAGEGVVISPDNRLKVYSLPA